MPLKVQHAGVPNSILPTMLFMSLIAVEKLSSALFQAPTKQNSFK